MSILLVLLASLLLVALPGFLLAIPLRARGYSPILCLGLALAGWVVVFSNVAAVAGYGFGLFLTLHVGLTLALGVWAWRRRKYARELWAAVRRVPTWQWLFYSALAAFFIAPAFVLQVPLDTDAQGFGYLALTVRLSGSITSLAPFHPEVHYLYSPAYLLIIAFLSDLTHLPIHQVMLGFSHLAAFGVALAAFELGREAGHETTGHFAALGTALGLGLFTTLLDSAYTNVFGIGLTATVLTLFFRAARVSPIAYRLSPIACRNSQLPITSPQPLTPNPQSLIFAALALASLPLAHPDSIIHLLLAYLPFYATMWLARPRPTVRQFAAVMAMVPLIGVGLTLPWMARVLPLVSGVRVKEHLFADWSYYLVLIRFHGWPILILGAIGIALALRRRALADVWMLTWLVPIVEFGLDGWLDRLALRRGFDPFQIMYPYGIVWHALILPLAYFAALALAAGARWAGQSAIGPRLAGLRAPICAAALAAGLGAAALNGPILDATKGLFTYTGAYATPADLRAMEWLKVNAPADALVLNYPDYESHWAPIVSERNAVYFRPQLFFIGDDTARKQWADLGPAYHDPAAPGSAEMMRRYGVDFVLVPQIVARPDLFPRMLRWRLPDLPPQRSSFDDAGFLGLVADFDGAKVYRLKK